MRVAFLGLGRMGVPMAAHVARAGHDLVVWNRTPGKAGPLLDLGAREALLRTLGRLTADPAAPALVLVSHHVEEVPSGFTHALLLRSGEIVASGPIRQVMRSSNLSACFGLPLLLFRHGDRYTARAALLSLR